MNPGDRLDDGERSGVGTRTLSADVRRGRELPAPLHCRATLRPTIRTPSVAIVTLMADELGLTQVPREAIEARRDREDIRSVDGGRTCRRDTGRSNALPRDCPARQPVAR